MLLYHYTVAEEVSNGPCWWVQSEVRTPRADRDRLPLSPGCIEMGVCDRAPNTVLEDNSRLV